MKYWNELGCFVYRVEAEHEHSDVGRARVYIGRNARANPEGIHKLGDALHVFQIDLYSGDQIAARYWRLECGWREVRVE